jgi:hypothetical protein
VGPHPCATKFKGVSDVTVRNCEVYDIHTQLDAHEASPSHEYCSARVTWENCELYNTGRGLFAKSVNPDYTCRRNFIHDVVTGFDGNCAPANPLPATNARIYENIILAFTARGIRPSSVTSGANKTFNNTIYDSVFGSGNEKELTIAFDAGTPHPDWQWNNILYKYPGSTGMDRRMYVGGGGTPFIDRNCYRGNNFRVEIGYSYGITSFAAWQAYVFGPDPNSIVGDPQFVSANPTRPEDFHLQPGSPCVHRGTNYLGLSPGYAGGSPDIGAYPRGNDGTVIGLLPTGAPYITITAPSGTGSYTTTNGTVNLAGTASDDVLVTQVRWTNAATGDSGTTTGTTSWTVSSVALAQGLNTITVRAYDGDGNVTVDAIDVTRWTPAVNQPPVANAGVNQSVLQGVVVTLNGGASDDPDDRPSALTYSWTQTAGPSVTLSGATTATPSFTTPNVAVQTALTFRLTVSDGAASDTDDVTVTVNPPGNVAPAANAGNDRTVTVGTPVTLSGSGNDSDGTIVSYLWTQTAGASITLNGGNTATATFTPAQAGDYTFRLTVTDDDAATGTDTVTITVQPPPSQNQAPVADAGEDQAVRVGNVVYLDARASMDPDGSTLTYAWQQVSGPAATLDHGDTSVATFAASEAATYGFRLTVSDGLLSEQDDVTIVAEEGGTGNTGDAPDGLQVIPNRVALADVRTVRVVGRAALAGKVLVYTVSGATIGSIDLLEDGSGAAANLGTALAVVPGLYLFVPEAAEDGVARLVVTP